MSKNNRKLIPSSAGHENEPKIPKAVHVDSSEMHPSWRIGQFDKIGPWGLNNLTKFTFHYSESILNLVIEAGDEELNRYLESINGKEFLDYSQFMKRLSESYPNPIELNILKAVYDRMTVAFFNILYPKLKEFEGMTWHKIDGITHGNKNKSENHFESIEQLGKDAQKRLRELNYEDQTEIYSLRLMGKVRIYGFRDRNCLDILWVDLNHSVYPVGK